MIAHLRGILLEKHPNQVIVDVQGVGYDVVIPVSTFSALPDAGAAVQLRIHTHVREDALLLFGFHSSEEKALFERLISVSGIGPSAAIKVLSGMASADLISSIRNSQVERLVKISHQMFQPRQVIGLQRVRLLRMQRLTEEVDFLLCIRHRNGVGRRSVGTNAVIDEVPILVHALVRIAHVQCG